MLNHQGVSRLCYAGTGFMHLPDGSARTREPLQLGRRNYLAMQASVPILKSPLNDQIIALGLKKEPAWPILAMPLLRFCKRQYSS
jgi:hypothetical protein